MALNARGEVWSWGGGMDGNKPVTGHGSNDDVLTPKRIQAFGSQSTIVHIAAGWDHSLAVDSTGKAWIWGYNTSSCTFGVKNSSSTSAVPLRVDTIPAHEVVAWIDGGQYHTVALTESGKVYTWGVAGNQLCQLASGGAHSGALPAAINTAVYTQPSSTEVASVFSGSFQSISAGDKFTLFLSSSLPPTLPTLPRRIGLLARLAAAFGAHGSAGSGGSTPLPPYPDAAWLCGPKASSYFADLPKLGMPLSSGASQQQGFETRYPVVDKDATTSSNVPQYVGWTFFPNLDSDGGDLFQSSIRGDQLAEYAMCWPTVIAFNTNGWLKTSLKPKSSWSAFGGSSPTQGLYVRNDSLPTGSTSKRQLLNSELKVLWSDKGEHSASYGMVNILKVGAFLHVFLLTDFCLQRR
jgi:hypothetical protein